MGARRHRPALSSPDRSDLRPNTLYEPLFILAVYAPGIAGLLLIWHHYGFTGLGNYFRRLTLWRMPVAWWVFLVIGIPALVYLAAALNGVWQRKAP